MDVRGQAISLAFLHHIGDMRNSTLQLLNSQKHSVSDMIRTQNASLHSASLHCQENEINIIFKSLLPVDVPFRGQLTMTRSSTGFSSRIA